MTMICLVPKSAFMGWFRDSLIGKGEPDDAEMKKQLKKRRDSIFWHFSKKRHAKTDDAKYSDKRPATCSNVVDEDDWVTDMDAAACDVSQTRR